MKTLPRNPRLDALEQEATALQQSHQAAACSVDDARRMVAREYGFPHWDALVQYVEACQLPLYHMVSDRTAYHRVITNSYDARSKRYDHSAWHREVAATTVNHWPPKAGHHVLDIATGTGTVAFHCAQLVGDGGYVVGVDLSSGMLAQCRKKLDELKLSNLAFAYGDGEQLGFAPSRFDRIYCTSAIFWMTNLQAALRHWHDLLKPGGVVGFNATPSSSFFWGRAARKALASVGIDYICNVPAGDEDNARTMMECAGFTNFRMRVAPGGKYVAVEEAKASPFITMDTYAPGQYPHPLQDVPPETLRQAQQAYDAEVDRYATEQGVWHDMTQLYFYAQKP